LKILTYLVTLLRYEEVVAFVKELHKYLPDNYEITCEHAHSNCILLSHTKFKINNEWYTFIDYERFHDLYNEYLRSGAQFTSMDYIAKTPSWALFGAQEGGFDPADTRHYRKQVPKNIGGC
jgi:tRNA wybutosine-synthesizing protein 1